MATYQSRQVQDDMPIPSHGLAVDVKCQRFYVEIGAALTTSDNIEFGYLPDYARVVDAVIVATDMDTNGSPTLTLNVGDADDADRYFAAATVGQNGSAARMTATTGFGHRYGKGKHLITGKPAANAATGAAGSIELFVYYQVDDPGVGTPS